MLAQPQRRVNIDGQGALDEIGAAVLDILITDPASVMDQRIEAAKGVQYLGKQLLAGLFIAKLGAVADHLVAFVAQGLGRGFGYRSVAATPHAVGAKVAYDDLSTGFCQGTGIVQAQATGAASDEYSSG
ncbi:hypothetical protein D9M71_706160 [compost metagenome]